MLKVVCEEFDQLKPIAQIIGNQDYKKKENGEKSIGKMMKRLKNLSSIIQGAKKRG